MKVPLLRWCYRLAFPVVAGVLSPYYVLRLSKRGNPREGLAERMGFYSPATRSRIGKGVDLWIHAVSVGEVLVALALLRELRKQSPELRVALTVTTITGRRVALGANDPGTTVLWSPIDFPGVVKRAFALLRPRALVLVETEVWPNYLWEAKRRKVPVLLLNARLSPETERWYRRFPEVCRPILRELSLVLAQAPEDVDRLVGAGFPPERIFVTGNLKYDVANLASGGAEPPRAWWDRSGWPADALILLAGSTHPGEEEILLDLYRKARQRYPNLRLVLAPRHVERSGAIEALCRKAGLSVVLRTELGKGSVRASSPDVLLLDTTGELRFLYGKATVVFIGKSLCAKGGQNFLEAACAGKPILVGPNMQNFEMLVREFRNEHAILQTSDRTELGLRLEELLRSKSLRAEFGKRAHAIFVRNVGAAARAAAIVSGLLRTRSGDPPVES
ncbi:3-deoxy-D-manno-octulosonic-acid transferase [Methylacidimicrobium cyclopophantes]|uniref:3-deoxy-D-manno-octulosonic acid transferase n=1 Tax=Methylacidimicrobium cyclopophantes TaxID=1041766 RepID=A0A5E6MEU3_9BACT|nr:glycosyltransferase N-terminal domain-containing protein [Methylacidimicrobium cyclopophantes]VVM07496.1 3-deoxy-D-manno-octulosonic-acid transferase [Methylacidimicrobium cyclopophantes]